VSAARHTEQKSADASEAGAPKTPAVTLEALESEDAALWTNPPEAIRSHNSNLAAPDADPKVPFADAGAAESERVVPLTRRRLRRQTASVAWPSLLDPSRTACGPEERAELLRSIDSLAKGNVREHVLLQALAEEAGELRLVALRALAQSPPAAGARVFADILVHGADEERSLAIDALIGIEHREELLSAFGDRVEAIAAKAVFAYVGSRRRVDYVDLLGERFERPRREAILNLLAGALE
jgi:hypothetical protein